MKLLIEEYQYQFDLVKELFPYIDELDPIDNKASVNFVGYFYHAAKQECVFVLPKVVLDQHNKVFGQYLPEQIIDLTAKNPLSQGESKFIYELSVWIYRAIAVYYAHHRDSTIVRHQKLIKVGRGRTRLSNTLLDILLALIDFNRQNKDWFMFILKNVHSGYNNKFQSIFLVDISRHSREKAHRISANNNQSECEKHRSYILVSANQITVGYD